MSIEREGNKYQLQCDYCSNRVEDFDDFLDAVVHKKSNGWKSINVTTGEWADKCPNCIGGENEWY